MTQLVRIAALATAFSAAAISVASAQRSRGTMGTPAVTPPPRVAAPSRPPSGRGTMSVPRYPSGNERRQGDLPRIVTEPRRPSSGYGSGYGSGHGSGYSLGGGIGSSSRDRAGRNYPYDRDRGYRGDRDRGTRYPRPPYTTYSPYSRRVIPCGLGCVRFGGGIRVGRVFGSFMIGYPFYVPIVVPYVYDATYVRYGDAASEADAPEPQREPAPAASKLIVVGAGTAGGGDALTVETVGDSVRLSWLGAGRSAREVRLFVSDSAQRQLASRSASPSAPNATFEVATLSAPVAFAGVSVTFTDGVTSTTVVPYRNEPAGERRR